MLAFDCRELPGCTIERAETARDKIPLRIENGQRGGLKVAVDAKECARVATKQVRRGGGERELSPDELAQHRLGFVTGFRRS